MTAGSRRGDAVLTVALLALFAGAFALSADWPFRTALFPRLVSATGMILAVVQLAVLAIRWRRDAAAGSTPASADAAADDAEVHDGQADHSAEYVFASAGGRAWAAALAWVAGFFVSLWLVGAAPTVPVFALLYLRFTGNASWRAAAVYAAVAGIVVVVIFGRLLSVPLPPGVL